MIGRHDKGTIKGSKNEDLAEKKEQGCEMIVNIILVLYFTFLMSYIVLRI